MSNRPSDDVVIWCPSGTKVLPGSTQIAQGWQPGQKPPSSFENYMQNLNTAWLDFMFRGGLFLGDDPYVTDDFIGSALSNIWQTPAASPAFVADNTAGGSGAVQIQATTTFTQVAVQSNLAMLFAQKNFRARCRVRPSVVTGGSVVFAVGGLATGGGTYVLAITVDSAAGGVWKGSLTTGAGTTTVTSAITPPSGSYTNLEIKRTGNGTVGWTFDFLVNDVSIGTIADNGSFLGSIGVIANRSSADTTVLIDHMRLFFLPS